MRRRRRRRSLWRIRKGNGSVMSSAKRTNSASSNWQDDFFSAKGINRQGMEWKCYVETAFSMSRPQAIYFCLLDKYASVATWHICGMFQIVCTIRSGRQEEPIKRGHLFSDLGLHMCVFIQFWSNTKGIMWHIMTTKQCESWHFIVTPL